MITLQGFIILAIKGIERDNLNYFLSRRKILTKSMELEM